MDIIYYYLLLHEAVSVCLILILSRKTTLPISITFCTKWPIQLWECYRPTSVFRFFYPFHNGDPFIKVKIMK